MNVVFTGQADQILIGEPKKTFWTYSYVQYSNFGKQHFRIDFDGQRDLRLTEPSKFTFNMPRYGDLISDVYVAVNIPNIWSPIYQPNPKNGNKWASYDFKWIKDLGAQMIQEIEITCGNFTVAKYSGNYLSLMVKRDFTKEKKEKFNTMSGNVPELNDPANAYGRTNTYPSAFYTTNPAGAEPSIRGRTLYIPINAWFTLDNASSFPLIALQYNMLTINVTIRPIQELFQCCDVFDPDHIYPCVQPDFNQSQFQMYRFLQTPPSVDLDTSNYTNQIVNWNADVHLEATYVFLSDVEQKKFAMEEHAYLVKDVYEYQFQNVVGSQRVELKTTGLVTSWMFIFQRNDINMRNEWSNYTNWPYNKLPDNIVLAPGVSSDPNYSSTLGPFFNPDGYDTGYFVSGDFSQNNQKNILLTAAILLDGDYRELDLPTGIFQYLEKYKANTGSPDAYEDGIYCYNFCLNSDPFVRQPSGAMNFTKFKRIQIGFSTYVPPVDPAMASFNVVCSADGVPVAIQKNTWQLYDYNYNLTVYEERYNVITFIGGYCGAMFAR